MDYYTPAVETQGVHEIAASEFTQEPDCAQYKGSTYQNAIRVERGISLEKAFEIAATDGRIHYFFFTKGPCMVLPVNSEEITDPLNLISDIPYQNDEDGSTGQGCRVFYYGDVVFFAKEGKWLGTAPGLADTYSKKDHITTQD
jgi:hypothetical protein